MAASSSDDPQKLASSFTSTSSDSEPRPVASLLEKLRSPCASELARKRKIDANSAPPTGKKRSTQNVRKFVPKSVRPSQRVSEFPGEELTESAGKLFCKACRENIAVKRSVVQNHIKSKKHAESKEKLKARVARE